MNFVLYTKSMNRSNTERNLAELQRLLQKIKDSGRYGTEEGRAKIASLELAIHECQAALDRDAERRRLL